MSGLRERSVTVNDRTCRVWEKGEGPAVGYLAGIGGLQAWTPFLDRLSETRRVVVPSLPGFPGGEGHDLLDSQLDWLLATHDLLRAAGLDGADMIGASVGGALLADVAALWPSAGRLVLIAPLGLFDPDDPVADIFAQRPGEAAGLLCRDPENYARLGVPPDGADAAEWSIIQTRASEAAARLLWPISDTGLGKRLHRLRQRVLLMWGDADNVVSPDYAGRFAERIAGDVSIEIVPDAGHLADLDAPDKVADTVLRFLDR